MFRGRQSETQTQFTFETQKDYWLNEWRRGRGKPLSYLWFKLRWKEFPKRRIVPGFPLNVDIEVSSVCNLKCDHCFRQYMDIGENHLMSFDLFRKIADECGRHGLYTLKFSMRGEPTVNPALPEMVAYAKKAGVKEIWINTHGGNITPDLARRLMQARPDWITMSFDGLGKMYESIRRPLKYEESLEKLRLLRQARDQWNPRSMLNVQSIWSAVKDTPQAYVDTMLGLADRVAFNADQNFKEIMLVPDDTFVCPRLWQRIAITSQGNFLKCPSDFRMEEILGNARDMTIKDAWDIRQQEQRRLHLAGRKKESIVCGKCHHGAKKVPRSVATEHGEVDAFGIEYDRQFSGVGLNRQKDEGACQDTCSLT